MGKRGGMSNVEISLDNVAAAFREGEKAGITVEKDNWRKETYKSYEKTVNTMIRELATLGGISEKRLLPKYMNGETWNKYFDHLEKRFENGELSGATIQKRVHAIEAFKTMVNNTNVCGKDTKIRVGDKEMRLEGLKDRGVVRSIDNITAIKPTKEESKAVHANFNVSTENGKISLTINKLQEACGGRIKSIFKLDVRDLDFKKGTITFRNDKNNHTRTVPMSPEARSILMGAVAGKSAGSPVFTMRTKDGNDMRMSSAVKTVQTYTNAAAKAAGVTRDKRRFTTHSNRKRYAQKLYDFTRYMTKKQLNNAIGDYAKLQGSNREQIVKRMKTELDRINAYRMKNGLEKKPYSHEQLRRMYVSLHLGHSRIDVVLSYINPDKSMRF